MLMKYDGLLISVEPDYNERIKNGEAIEDLYCEVYDEDDTELNNQLGDFNMTIGFEFDKETKEDIETAIKKMVDSDWSSYQLEKKTMECDHINELLENAVEYIKESFGEDEALNVLKDSIGMTEEEIEAMQNHDEGMKMQ